MTTSADKPATVPSVRPAAETGKTMLAAVWHGRRDIRIADHPRPVVSDPLSALVRITATAICSTDLHLYHGELPGLRKGDIFGHEGVGVVENVGEQVTHVKAGDRVVISSVIACGTCFYCQQEKFSLCDHSNQLREAEDNPGHRNAGLFGYSRLFSGYNGCQAEYVRVPYADINLLPLPESIDDDQAIFLSDTLGTSWHANELGEVSDGKTVAIWGCGQVGLLAIRCAKLRGASKVVAIDDYSVRLTIAKDFMGADEIIDYSREKDVVKKLLELIPGGPDVAIDCVGSRHRPGFLSKVEKAMRLEIDNFDALNEAITAVRKGGIVSVVGDYHHRANYFPLGNLTEKGVFLHSGQPFIQKYWKQLLDYLEDGGLNPAPLLTHTLPLRGAADAYKIFDKKQENALKVVLKPFWVEKTKEEQAESGRSEKTATTIPIESSPTSDQGSTMTPSKDVPIDA